MAAKKMTVDRAKLIRDFVAQFYGLARRDGTDVRWIALKLSCTMETAERSIRQAKTIIGPKLWTVTMDAAKQRGSVAMDAVTAAAAREHNPAPDRVVGPTFDPKTFKASVEAERIVRDWLEGEVVHYQQELKRLLQQDREPVFVEATRIKISQDKALAAAVILLAGSCLDHLDAEAKRARADDAEDQAEIERQTAT